MLVFVGNFRAVRGIGPGHAMGAGGLQQDSRKVVEGGRALASCQHFAIGAEIAFGSQPSLGAGDQWVPDHTHIITIRDRIASAGRRLGGVQAIVTRPSVNGLRGLGLSRVFKEQVWHQLADNRSHPAEVIWFDQKGRGIALEATLSIARAVR